VPPPFPGKTGDLGQNQGLGGGVGRSLEMTDSLLTFPKGGVHPPEYKELTEHLAIENFPTPDELDILLIQHFGAPCEPRVSKKDKVTEGDLIGEVESGLGANIHSSVTGTIRNIGASANAVSVTSPSITIKTDPEAQPKEYTPSDWKALSREELLSRVKSAGIVGIGGAGFPTHVKLNPPPEARVDTLIINGAECEPYLTTDHRVMLEHAQEVVDGAKIILTILGIKVCHIGIESNKMDAIEAMRKSAREASSEGFNISIDALEVKYPQGSEKQLIQSVMGRKVPGFGLPFDVGLMFRMLALPKPSMTLRSSTNPSMRK